MRTPFLVYILSLSLYCLFSHSLQAQDTLASKSKLNVNDSTRKKDSTAPVLPWRIRMHNAVFVNHSPKVAGLMSAIIPGTGQAYNRKYWKMPLVYGGAALVIYFFKTNFDDYNQSTTSYRCKIDSIFRKSNSDPLPQYSSDQVHSLRQYYRRNLDLTALAGIGLYALNIVDAMVDAHLYHFDVSNNLSMKIQPSITPAAFGSTSFGLSLKFSFKK